MCILATFKLSKYTLVEHSKTKEKIQKTKEKYFCVSSGSTCSHERKNCWCGWQKISNAVGKCRQAAKSSCWLSKFRRHTRRQISHSKKAKLCLLAKNIYVYYKYNEGCSVVMMMTSFCQSSISLTGGLQEVNRRIRRREKVVVWKRMKKTKKHQRYY